MSASARIRTRGPRSGGGICLQCRPLSRVSIDTTERYTAVDDDEIRGAAACASCGGEVETIDVAVELSCARLSSRTLAILCHLGWGVLMAQAPGSADEEFDPQPVEAEEIAVGGARHSVHARRRKISASQATAGCLERSAESHERIAAMYEAIAERTSNAEECRQCASRHRASAMEDRSKAARLRAVPGAANRTGS